MMQRTVTFRRLVFFLFALIGLAAAGGSVQAEVVDLSGISTLRNGFEVRLFPETSTPVVAALVMVRTGYASEEASKSGFSHLLEHLVFAGTGERTKEDIQREVKDLGGYINGFTRDDYTG